MAEGISQATKELAESAKIKTVQHPLLDKEKCMRAVEWHGTKDVRVVEKAKPMITEPNDALIRVTSTTICGSDLHMYLNLLPGEAMKKHDTLGHEFMGVVEAVGDNTKNIKVGDRVVVSAIISCGSCWYCQHQMYSACDCTNPSKEMESLYGHRSAGIFGYSHLTGGYEGGQAEYVRVPFADVNCLQVPAGLSDEKALLLSDVCCTGFHATELGEVGEGDVVAVFGCGPIGLMAQMCAKMRGASRIIAIDTDANRLNFAHEKIGSEILNCSEKDVVNTMREMCPERGPDVVIEAAGFRFPKTFLQKFQSLVKLETDAMDILNEAIKVVRKCGRISVVGDYFAYGNQFNIGAFMEKGLQMKSGQVFVQKYWKELLAKIESGQLDPSILFTHQMSLDEAPKAYSMFSNHEALKVLLKPASARASALTS